MNNNEKKLDQEHDEIETERLDEAKRNLEKIQKKIAPFLKRRKFKAHSTSGKWQETSNLQFKNL